MQLPSKKIVPIFLACAVAGGGIAYAATYQIPVQPNPHLIVETLQAQTPSLSNDGSWKKTLATIVPAAATSTNATSTNTDADGSTTVTENISKELLSSYLEQTQNGGVVTPDFENSLVTQLVSQSDAATDASNIKIYSISDIKISDTAGSAAIHAYGNALAEVIRNNSAGTTTDELVIYGQASENNDPGYVNTIQPIIQSYQKTLTDFLAMSVPRSAASLHLALINSYSQIISIDETLMKFPTDPAASMYGLQQYQTGSVAVYDSIKAYAAFFSDQGVTFAPGEPGFMLSNQGN